MTLTEVHADPKLLAGFLRAVEAKPLPVSSNVLALARERLELAPSPQINLQPGSVVRSGRRRGTVVVVIRRKALVMWERSSVAAWNQTRLLRLA